MPPVPPGRRRFASLRLGIAILLLDVLAGLLARGMIGPGAAWRGALLATVIAGTPARARPAAARAPGHEARCWKEGCRRLGGRPAEER